MEQTLKTERKADLWCENSEKFGELDLEPSRGIGSGEITCPGVAGGKKKKKERAGVNVCGGKALRKFP